MLHFFNSLMYEMVRTWKAMFSGIQKKNAIQIRSLMITYNKKKK